MFVVSESRTRSPAHTVGLPNAQSGRLHIDTHIVNADTSTYSVLENDPDSRYRANARARVPPIIRRWGLVRSRSYRAFSSLPAAKQTHIRSRRCCRRARKPSIGSSCAREIDSRSVAEQGNRRFGYAECRSGRFMRAWRVKTCSMQHRAQATNLH
jgi:hypothetical protein